MKGNYNDIVDVILTLIEDDELRESIAVAGSIVPYLVLNEESEEVHTDFYVLVKGKKMDYVRDKLKELSKEYDFNISSDSLKYTKNDCGFKIKYQSTTIGFFPYTLIDYNLTIKTYSINVENMQIKLKTKVIPNISKSSVIRQIDFGKKRIRIMSPEFVLVEKEMRERQDSNPTEKTMKLLKKISDEVVLSILRKNVVSTRVDIETKSLKKKDISLYLILIVVLISLLVIAYICFKK